MTKAPPTTVLVADDHAATRRALRMLLEGETAIRELRAAAPETAIVALTLQADPAFARRALLDGADGFVLKDLATERLADAVRATVRDAGYLAPHVDHGRSAQAPGAVSVSAAPRRGA